MTCFEHEAFVYDSDEAYVAGLVPYLRQGIAAGDEIIVVVTEERAGLLRSALDEGEAVAMTFIDAVEWYRRPHHALARYDAVLRDLAGHPARVVGEVQFGDDEQSWADWTRYESALNRALADHRARVVCPYDVRRLTAEVVADARRTHPILLAPAGEGSSPSDGYEEPERLVAGLHFEVALPVEEPDVDMVIADVRAARHAFTLFASSLLDDDRVAELALAVNEVLTNAVVHGVGKARLRAWATGPGAMVCTIEDEGDGTDDPLVGFVRASDDSAGGRGMWLARSLFDRAEVTRLPDAFRVTLAVLG